MKSIVTPLVLAVVLLGTGLASWSLGQAQTRIAEVERQVATMEYDTVSATPAAPPGALAAAIPVPGFGDEITRAVENGRATAGYWMGRYDGLGFERDAGGAQIEKNPRLLLLAANAAFRSSQLDRVDRNTAVDRLDAVVRNYGDVLKTNPPGDVLAEAAFNYEFATRMRTALERARPGTTPAAAREAAPVPGIHGRAGGPPADSDPNEFKVVVPKRSDERDQNPEGGEGQEKIRKG
jgi:hypothetical protein